MQTFHPEQLLQWRCVHEWGCSKKWKQAGWTPPLVVGCRQPHCFFSSTNFLHSFINRGEWVFLEFFGRRGYKSERLVVSSNGNVVRALGILCSRMLCSIWKERNE